jgi:hypothetical protein
MPNDYILVADGREEYFKTLPDLLDAIVLYSNYGIRYLTPIIRGQEMVIHSRGTLSNVEVAWVRPKARRRPDNPNFGSP